MKKNKNEKNLLFIFIMLTLVFFSFFNAKSIYGLEKICNNKTSCLILPTYERNETIVADFILEPDTDLTKDRSDDIQLALNKCMNEKKGGTVFLEEGIYVVKKPIIIPKLCTLKGDWQDPDSVNNIDNLKYGTIIVVDIDDENYIDFYKSQITSSIPLIHENDINVSNLSDIVEEVGLFTLEDNSGVDGLTIFYKNQNALNPSIQPWTFLYSEEFDLSNRNLLKTIKNITLINSYNGIGNSFSNSFLGTEDYPIFEKRRPHEMLMIENVKGTVLNKGVVVHNSSDVGTITGLELSPKYWANANISSLNALTKPSIDEINNYTKARGWGLTITDVEQQQYYNIKISGYKYGLYIPNINTRIMGSGSFFDIEISNCQVGIIIDKGTHKGNWMLGIIEQPLEGFDLPMLDFSTGYLISNSSIQGDDYAILHLGNEVDGSLFNINNSKYNKIRGRLKLHDVSINGKVNDGRSGEGYTIPGILYYDENNSNYSILENGIYNNNKNGKFRNINLERKTKTTGNVLEVVDSLITADLLNQVLSEVSKKGGGVVYLKAGLYTFNKTIEIPENVELRGVAGVSVRSAGAMPIGEILDNPIENVQGTVIKVARVSDDENQNFATIKLIGDNSGVSGITFIYEENIDILRGNNVNKFDKNHNRIIFSQGTKGIFIKNIALIGAAYGIYLDNCKYFTIANVVSGLLENVIYMNSSSNGVIVNCLQNLSLISRNDIYFVEEQKMIDNGFPITRKTLKYFVIEDSDNIEMLNNFIYGGFVYLESKDSSIYAINNGNDGFGSEDENHNYVGWQFAFSHDNNKYPNDEKVNNVILINNLRVGGYSIINALGNLGIYNRDFFFKWTQDADPIEKDFLIGTPLMIQPDYKEYNKTKIVSNTNVVYGSNSELVNVYNAEGTIYYSTEKELTSENYMVDGSITVPKAINKDAGEYSCYYYIPEDDKHLEKKGMVKILISKKPLVLTAGSSSRAWNNEALTNRECIANSGGLVSGHIITCSMTSESTITTAGSVNNEISTVTIKSGTTDVTGNYIITKVTGKLTVTVATPKVSLTSKTATYTGSAIAANTATVSPNGGGTITYTYYTDSSCTTGATTIAPTNAGTYYVKATVSAVANKTTAASSSCVSHTITQKELTITAKNQILESGQINIGIDQVIIDGLLPDDQLTYITLTSLHNDTIVPSNAVIKRKNNSEEEITYNYSITYNNGLLTIISENTSANCPTIESYNGTYDGNEHGIIIGSGLSGGELFYKIGDDWSLEYPTRKDVGITTVYVKVKGDESHHDVDCGSKIINISKSEIIDNTKDQRIIYDGQEHSIELDIASENINILYADINDNYNLNNMPKYKNVGEYEIKYKIFSDNYNDYYANKKLSIHGISKVDSTLKIKDNLLIVRNYINNINTLKSGITLFADTVKWYHLSTNKSYLTEEKFKTGEYLQLEIDDLEKKEYQIVILGDSNGDGIISALDYVRIKNHIMKEKMITNLIYLTSSDVNEDDKITALDYVRIKNHIMNGG